MFVYTLANIITGEIAIRHKIGGETSFYIFPDYSEITLKATVAKTFAANRELTHIIGGWVDYDDGRCSVRMGVYELTINN